MKFFMSLLLLVSVVGCSTFKKQEEAKTNTPQIAFEVTEGIRYPESIIYSDKHKAFFVSNVASGDQLEKKSLGYISKISPDGKIVEAKWVAGLRAPKGLLVLGDDLYVTDINRVVKINILTKKITKTFQHKGTKFLNDLAVDNEGRIYVSDMFNDVIYRIEKNKMVSWLKDPRVAGCNGLFTDGKEHLIAVRWGVNIDQKSPLPHSRGDITIIPLANKTDITHMNEIQGHLEGIAVDNKGTLWISDWVFGDIYTMTKQGKTQKMFNLGYGAADLTVAKELNLLAVPQMNDSKLIFIKL